LIKRRGSATQHALAATAAREGGGGWVRRFVPFV
jgi:hypothetical protein